MYTESVELLEQGERETLGRWSRNKRYVTLATCPCSFRSSALQAHYFKSMLRSAGHLERVKRMRVSEKDTAPLLPIYEVSVVYSHVAQSLMCVPDFFGEPQGYVRPVIFGIPAYALRKLQFKRSGFPHELIKYRP